MLTWRLGHVNVNEISSAWDEDEPFDKNISLPGYGYQREQREEETSETESEISKSLNSDRNRAKKKTFSRRKRATFSRSMALD